MAEGNSLFEIGMVLATPGAIRLMLLNNVQPQHLLKRHVTGDWSEMDMEDQATNHEAIKYGARIFSAYRVSPTHRIWVITESDRWATTLLRPEDY